MTTKQSLQWSLIFTALTLFTIGSVKEMMGLNTRRVALAAEPQGQIIITNRDRFPVTLRSYREKDIVICYPRVEGIKLDRDYHIFIGDIPEGIRSSILIDLDAHLECRTHSIRIPILSFFHVS